MRLYTFRTWIFLLLLVSSTFAPLGAQPLPTPLRYLNQMTSRPDIPKDLLRSRSVFVISMQPNAQGQLDPDRMQEWAASFQTMFSEEGVDVVAVFQTLDMLSGRETWAAFEELLVNRRMRNLVWLQESTQGNFRISLASLPEQTPLLATPLQAYSLEAPDVETLKADLRREIIRASLTRENNLVLGTPEIFRDVPMIKKRRYEDFPMDMRLDKVAIRWPEDAGDVTKEAFGAHLDSLYPYEFGFVPFDYTDQQVQGNGYQYVLDWVYAPGISLREVFNYEIKEGETSFITFMTLGPNEKDIKNISIHVPVYKFYMRHMVTGDLYLGKEWDADVTWEDALRHFIFNYRAEEAGRRRR